MRPTALRLVLGSAFFLSASPLAAHHSFDATYAMSEKVTIEGDVERVFYRNPHSFLRLKGKVPGTDEVIIWAVEWNGANRLGREGVTGESLRTGDHVVVTGQPGRQSQKYRGHRLLLESVQRPADGWNWHRGRRFD